VNKVSDLINPITSSWDEELVRDVFWPEDAGLILSIPLIPGYEDFLAWHYDPECSQSSPLTMFWRINGSNRRGDRLVHPVLREQRSEKIYGASCGSWTVRPRSSSFFGALLMIAYLYV